MTEILYYERENKNKTIGYVDILIPIKKPVNLILRKVSHVQSGDRRWFNLASFNRQKQDGSNNYLKFAQFEIEAYNTQLLEGLGEKLKEYCQKNNIEELQAYNFDESPVTRMDEAGLPF